MTNEELENISVRADMELEKIKDKARFYDELQHRINKAIEYIDRRDIEWGSEEHNKLLSILKGSDKE